MQNTNYTKLNIYNYQWKLLYFLDARASELFNETNVLFFRSEDGMKFSDLYLLSENMKINNYFEFLMVFEYENKEPLFYYWLQNVNPIETELDQEDIGFIPLYSSYNETVEFYGLSKSSTNRTFLAGPKQVEGDWHYSIGSYGRYYDNIPGPLIKDGDNPIGATKAYFYVRVLFSPSCKQSYPTRFTLSYVYIMLMC